MVKPGPRYQASIQLLRASESLWNSSRIFLASWDISPSQFNILNLLRDKMDGCTQTELSRQLIMHRSNATGLVDRLETRGLVKRKTMPGDRRAFQVVLTAHGRTLIQRILPFYYHAAEAIWGEMPVEEVERVTAEIADIARNAARVAATRRSIKAGNEATQGT